MDFFHFTGFLYAWAGYSKLQIVFFFFFFPRFLDSLFLGHIMVQVVGMYFFLGLAFGSMKFLICVGYMWNLDEYRLVPSFPLDILCICNADLVCYRRKISCKSLSFPNLFFALEESLKWSCWAECRLKRWTDYTIYGKDVLASNHHRRLL